MKIFMECVALWKSLSYFGLSFRLPCNKIFLLIEICRMLPGLVIALTK